jgi:hypothetical protein
MLGKDKLDDLVTAAYDTVAEENEETAFVGAAMLIMEVRTGNGETAFYTFCSDKRQWVQKAIVREAEQAIEMEEVEFDGD